MKRTTYALQKALHNERNILDLRKARTGLYVKEKKPFYDILLKRKEENEVKHSTHNDMPISYRALSLLIIMVLSLSHFFVGPTLSYYYNTEKSEENLFNSGLVDFTLEAHPFMDMNSEIKAGTSTLWGIDIFPHDFSNPFYYHASSTNFYGDLDFCESLNVVAEVDGNVLYTGPLTELLSATTTNISVWEFSFSAADVIPNSICHFDIDFNGRQTRHGLTDGGFTDTETVQYWLSSGGIVINKVYFEKKDPCGCDDDEDDDKPEHSNSENIEIINNNEATTTNTVIVGSNTGGNSGTSTTTGDATASTSITNIINTNTTTIGSFGKGDHEWVELYNQTGSSIDISGWKLCDGQECEEIPDSDPIPPYGFAVIAENEKVFEEIHVPDGIVKIIMPDGSICDELNNKKDMLLLARPDHTVIDQLNWGTPDMLWPNYNGMVWDPGIPTPHEGSVLARIPTGHDTNAPEDFVELKKPKLKKFGIEQKIKYYAADTYKISWEADNLNGNDEELRVDLYYILDGNEIVIAENTPNDGEFYWTVPHNTEGKVYIKIVVTSPENILLNITKQKKIHIFIKHKKEKDDDEESGDDRHDREEREEREERETRISEEISNTEEALISEQQEEGATSTETNIELLLEEEGVSPIEESTEITEIATTTQDEIEEDGGEGGSSGAPEEAPEDEEKPEEISAYKPEDEPQIQQIGENKEGAS